MYSDPYEAQVRTTYVLAPLKDTNKTISGLTCSSPVMYLVKGGSLCVFEVVSLCYGLNMSGKGIITCVYELMCFAPPSCMSCALKLYVCMYGSKPYVSH